MASETYDRRKNTPPITTLTIFGKRKTVVVIIGVIVLRE